MASRDRFDASLEAAQGSGDAGEDRKRKKTMGRQKIQIKRIDSEQKRQVCFSKRKDGLFKKASDLAVLCGAHVAAVAFSPGGKPFSFGHPSVQALVDRFTAPSAAPSDAPVHPALLEEFSREEDFLTKALEAEASRKKALDAAMRQAGVWTGGGVMNEKSLPELVSMHGALEKVQAEVAVRIQELMAQEAMATNAGGMFMAYGEVNSQHHDDQAVMDTRMMMLPPYSHYFDLIKRGALF